MENAIISIGSYAQGNYDNPNGCITVVKTLVASLTNGKPPLISPAGYDLIWTDKKAAPIWTEEGTKATAQVSIIQLPGSQAIVALPGHNAPGSITDLNPTGMCQ